ncbi:GNAT family N-acetyltransferase [Blautia sp. Marseille-P3201T]|uniref:GNAT family N-acetyltransferase n=1 Tax=Blautia sp. Marseille-P3201T TaxID=1907659 RepID=UPI000931D35B|nr:GNAT family N-acetyltransferase [Blautia sp. Marseille-P3201T]
MIIYRKALPKDFPSILNFINMVFSMSHSPHDFRQLLPKLYEEGQEEKSIHYLALENGEIKAYVCVLPITLCCGFKTITCATVGSVSVHPYSRGKGYMRNLMHTAIQDMKDNNISMSTLSGLRNRYQYYGYEKGGFVFQYCFTSDNFRHCRQKFPERKITLRQIQNEKDPLLAKIRAIQENQILFIKRNPKDFLFIMESWNTKFYGILENQICKGYVALQGNHILEMYLTDEDLLFASLEKCLKESNSKELFLRIAPYDTSLIKGCTQLFESFTTSLDDNYMIFDYPKVLEFFLNVKSSYIPLTSGSLDITIKEQGSFRIQVDNGAPSVTQLKKSKEKSNLEFSSFESILALFSPNYHLILDETQLPENCNWFPLPLALSPLDKC